MTTRYLQATGGSSFFVTLPKDWITRNNIKVKDELNIFQTNNNSLVINKVIKKQSQIEINVDNISNSILAREIIACYVSGYEKIMLKTDDYFSVETRKIIREQLKLLTGYESAEEDSKQITISNTINSNTPLKTQVLKILKSIISMYEDLENAIKNKYQDLAEDIIARDDEIDKINLYISKRFIEILNNFGVNEEQTVSLTQNYFYQQQSQRLERIADHIVKASRQVVDSNKYIINEHNKKGLLITNKYLKLVEMLLISDDKKIAHKILDGFEKLKEESRKIKKKEFNEFNTVVNNCFERIVSYTANIAEDYINILN